MMTDQLMTKVLSVVRASAEVFMDDDFGLQIAATSYPGVT